MTDPAADMNAEPPAPPALLERALRALKERPGLRQALTFAAIGLVGTSVNAAIYAALVVLGVHYLMASTVAWAVSVTVVYALNRRFTFKSSAPLGSSLVKTFLVYAAQQAFVLGELALFIEVFGIHELVAYLLAIPLSVLVSFFGMKYYAFRH